MESPDHLAAQHGGSTGFEVSWPGKTIERKKPPLRQVKALMQVICLLARVSAPAFEATEAWDNGFGKEP